MFKFREHFTPTDSSNNAIRTVFSAFVTVSRIAGRCARKREILKNRLLKCLHGELIGRVPAMIQLCVPCARKMSKGVQKGMQPAPWKNNGVRESEFAKHLRGHDSPAGYGTFPINDRKRAAWKSGKQIYRYSFAVIRRGFTCANSNRTGPINSTIGSAIVQKIN